MLFSQIPGQYALKERLLRSVQESRISHAQLFLGPEGCGSLTLALAYTQYIFCENRSANDACGVCSSCVKVQKLVHPDLHFSFPFVSDGKGDKSTNYLKPWRQAVLDNPYLGIENWMSYLDAGNKQPNITVDECHDIISRLSLKAYESDFKVIIIWLPEYLGLAGNTLLKLIEEPPEKTVFLLVAEKYDQLLNTILSRVQLLKIPAFTDDDVRIYLSNYELTDDQKSSYAFLANGSLNEALQLLEAEESDLEELFVKWFRLCYTRKGIELQTWIDEVATAKFGRERQKNMLRFGLEVLRDCMIYNAQAESILRFQSRHFELPKLAAVINTVNGPLLIGHLEKAIYHIERNANPKILFLDLSVQMMRDLQRKS
jgi:DNA polymerase III subunit delta'